MLKKNVLSITISILANNQFLKKKSDFSQIPCLPYKVKSLSRQSGNFCRDLEGQIRMTL